MIQNTILTKKALKVINKKLEGRNLTQQDSNYLSRFVRPKLRDISAIDAKALLKKLEYSPRAISIEKKIEEIILNNIPKVDSIIICGSAIQTNYQEYKDIDIIVATNGILTKSLKEKNQIIKKIQKTAKKENLNLDIQIYSKSSIMAQYPHSPSLIYQLKDSKVIYGKLKVPNKIKLSNLDLKMKLDWSEGLTNGSKPDEIYYAIRNAALILLLMNKKVDNYQLTQNLINTLGSDLITRLKNNQASQIDKKLALAYLILLTKHLESELNKTKWEKIEIENR